MILTSSPPIHTHEIIKLAGPGFRCNSSEIQRCLYCKINRAVSWDPLYFQRDSIKEFSLPSFNSKPVGPELELFYNSLKNQYYRTLGDCFYAQKRLGKNHRSVKLIKEHLVESNLFRYSTYDTYSEDLVRRMCIDCLDQAQKTPVYNVVKDKLDLLKIPFSLTLEELMDCVGKSK